MGGGGKAAPNSYIGNWGNFGTYLPPAYLPTPSPSLARQRGIISYTLASNRQKPTAGALRGAIFNGWRRFRGQVLYVAPPFIAGYLLLDWAEKRNHFLNSKQGMALQEADD
ncbi:hypothetical protein ABW20_dc0104069 [Dactylellina cionopaga]|nr:hypothetical protein ABW20_dc0104069 [Dactylellina cionopaga]